MRGGGGGGSGSGSGGMGKGIENPSKSIDEVDEMLRAAEDELLLGLTKNTHTTAHRLHSPIPLPTPSPTFLDPDLARRFEALKAPLVPRHAKAPTEGKPTAPPADAAADDLMARFAALKGHDCDPKSGVPSDALSEEGPVIQKGSAGVEGGGDGAVSEAEVDKVLQWAMDAVRLDISSGKSGGDDDRGDGGDGLDGGNSDSEDEAEEEERRKKMEGKKGKKWFLFR